MSWTREEYAKRTKGLELTAEHHKMLIDSAISLDVAVARGYRSATQRVGLARAGFTNPNIGLPALVVPVHNVSGDLATYQVRRDETPVDRDGKPTKYLTKKGTRMVVDVPPTIRHLLGDPEVPLFITEGSKKADAAASTRTEPGSFTSSLTAT